MSRLSCSAARFLTARRVIRLHPYRSSDNVTTKLSLLPKQDQPVNDFLKPTDGARIELYLLRLNPTYLTVASLNSILSVYGRLKQHRLRTVRDIGRWREQFATSMLVMLRKKS